jgi:ComF family protein
MKRQAISLIAPNVCPFCDNVIASGEYWHDACYGALPIIDKNPDPVDGLSELFACCDYCGTAREAVLRMKGGNYIYAAEALALLMTEQIGSGINRVDVITSVPSSLRRRIEMVYIPAEKIAKIISIRSGKPYIKTLAVTKFKNQQKLLGEKERRENAKQSFRLDCGGKIRGRTILIIDDVCTTGSTLSACAELLRKGGAADVMGAVFAKTVYKKT